MDLSSGDYRENGPAIARALLDGIPESVAIGLTIISGGAVGIATVVAVFISNIPEGLSSSVGMKSMGWSKKTIFGLWFLIAIITGLSSLAGSSVFSQFPPDVNAALWFFQLVSFDHDSRYYDSGSIRRDTHRLQV